MLLHLYVMIYFYLLIIANTKRALKGIKELDKNRNTRVLVKWELMYNSNF